MGRSSASSLPVLPQVIGTRQFRQFPDFDRGSPVRKVAKMPRNRFLPHMRPRSNQANVPKASGSIIGGGREPIAVLRRGLFNGDESSIVARPELWLNCGRFG